MVYYEDYHVAKNIAGLCILAAGTSKDEEKLI